MTLIEKSIRLLMVTGLLSGIFSMPVGAMSLFVSETSAESLNTNKSDRLSQTSPQTEADRLFDEAVEEFETNELPESLEKLQEVLEIRQQAEDRPNIGRTAEQIALVYEAQGKYPTALDFYEQALEIAEELGDRSSQARILRKIGLMNSTLGRYQLAVASYQQAVTIQREVDEPANEAETLNSIGAIYGHLEAYVEAEEFYQQSLEIQIKLKDRLGEAKILDSLGVIYRRSNQYEDALGSHQKALAIYRELGGLKGEASALNNMGVVYRETERFSEALNFLNEAFLIQKEIGDRNMERVTLANMAKLFEKVELPELAIIFYKQSINLTESNRGNIPFQPVEERGVSAENIAKIYRSFSNLLLEEGRSQEAQQIVDLGQIQELDEYLRGVPGNEKTQNGVQLLEAEEKFWDKYIELIAAGIPIHQNITELRKIELESGGSDRTATQRRQELESDLDDVLTGIGEFVDSAEVEDSVGEVKKAARDPDLKTDNLVELQRQLQEHAKGNTAILYPIVLDDRLEIVLVTTEGSPVYRTVNVSRVEVQGAIAQFRTAITNRGRAELLGRVKNRKNPDKQVTDPGFQLYQWLIQPLEATLELGRIETILYAGDGQLRYVPLGGLYDGNQWLAQRFKINSITAANLIDFESESSSEERTILAGALTEGSFDFEAGKQQYSYDYLPYASVEVEAIAATFPNTVKLLGSDFARTQVLPRMNDKTIVHLATHAGFVEGVPEDSFILFGDGNLVSLEEVREWNLNNVDLIVLSACQTGVGGVLGNGREVLGFGYQLQQAGALATLATLWRVDDRATQEFMKAFYERLRSGATKAEALQQAQNKMLASDLDHPYYWAPFILIGNGF